MGLERDIWQDWLAALRSGRYPKALGQLRRGDTYCAIGVLCDLHPDLQWEWVEDRRDPIGRMGTWEAVDKASNLSPSDALERNNAFLPSSFVTRYELWGALTGRSVLGDVSTYNDGNRDFAWIADVIEQRKLGL